jgi:spore maturation protein CgeB
MRTASEPLRILYVGDLTPGGTCAQRRRAFEDLGCQLTPVALIDAAARRRARALHERVRRRLLGPRDWLDANRQIVEHARQQRFDILWIDRGLTIEAKTLAAVHELQPQCRIVGYSPDDMYARHNQSPQFRRHLSRYDIYFTTKSYGVDELRAIGCPAVAFSGNAYDPGTHRPLPVDAAARQQYGGQVGFVGSWEAARAASMVRLASEGIPVRVWGNMWERQRQQHADLRVEGRALYGDDYALAINAFDINLCFLRKLNRDLQTQRSVEIPACGAFMLAERTDEHQALFAEGREAEFFGSDDELLEKTRHYLAHPEQRRRIAAAGRERCLRDGYSYQDRLAEILDRLGLRWRRPAPEPQVEPRSREHVA